MKRGSTKKGLQQHLVVLDGQGLPQCLLVRSASAQNAQEVGNAYCVSYLHPGFSTTRRHPQSHTERATAVAVTYGIALSTQIYVNAIDGCQCG